MEIKIEKRSKDYLKEIPRYEEWRGEGGKTLISERLFALCHEGSVEEIKLSPTFRIGANYAHYPLEEGIGVDYEISIKEAGFSVNLKMNSFLILKREFKSWSGQEVVDNVTVILVEDAVEDAVNRIDQSKDVYTHNFEDIHKIVRDIRRIFKDVNKKGGDKNEDKV